MDRYYGWKDGWMQVMDQWMHAKEEYACYEWVDRWMHNMDEMINTIYGLILHVKEGCMHVTD